MNEKGRSTIQYNEKKKKKKKKKKKRERLKPSPKTCFYRKRNARMSSGFRVIIFDL